MDAGASRGGDQKLRGAACDHTGVRRSLSGLDDMPARAGKLLQRDGRAGEGVKAPAALDGAGDQHRLGLRGRGRSRRGWGLCFGWLRGLVWLCGWGACRRGGGGLRFEQLGIVQFAVMGGSLLQDQASLVGIGNEWDVGLGGRSGRRIQVQHDFMGEVGGEDQRRAFDGQYDGGFNQAGNVVRVRRAKWRRDRRLHRGEPDDEHRLGIVEGGRCIQPEVECRVLGEGDGRDVLVLRGVEGAHEADQIDDCADIGGIQASTGSLRITSLIDEVGTRAVGECGGDVLAVAVVEQGLGAGLGEAGELGVDRALEAVLVGFQVQRTGEQIGVFLEGLGVGGRNPADGGHVFLDTGLFEAGFGEVLRGADEDSRPALDGGAQGREVAAGLWRHKEHGLLRFGRHGDEDAFFSDLLVPGLDAGEPVLWGRVGGSAKEDADQEVLNRLRGRQVRVQPDLVARLEIGDRGDGEGLVATSDPHVDARTDEVKTAIRVEWPQEEEEQERQQKQSGAFGHTASLDA